MKDVSKLLEPLRRLHETIRAAVVDACERANSGELATVVSEEEGDTIFAHGGYPRFNDKTKGLKAFKIPASTDSGVARPTPQRRPWTRTERDRSLTGAASRSTRLLPTTMSCTLAAPKPSSSRPSPTVPATAACAPEQSETRLARARWSRAGWTNWRRT